MEINNYVPPRGGCTCWGDDWCSHLGGNKRKNFRHDHGSDGWEETNYKAKAKTRKSAKTKTRPGCPENNFGPHIYLWTEEFEKETLFSRYFGFNEKQHRVCCGCRKSIASKNSDEYEKRKAKEFKRLFGDEFSVKRGEPVRRWGRFSKPTYSYWHWENYDKDYVAYRKDYIARHGFNSYVYGF